MVRFCLITEKTPEVKATIKAFCQKLNVKGNKYLGGSVKLRQNKEALYTFFNLKIELISPLFIPFFLVLSYVAHSLSFPSALVTAFWILGGLIFLGQFMRTPNLYQWRIKKTLKKKGYEGAIEFCSFGTGFTLWRLEK